MRILYSTIHRYHQPPAEIFNGHSTPHQEVPARIANILAALRANGFNPEKISGKVPSSVLEGVHGREYVAFLKAASSRIPEGIWQYPSVFSLRTSYTTSNSAIQQGGYSFDMFTPISSTTYLCALSSAKVAYEAAKGIQIGRESTIYALCRPPFI